MIRKVNGQRVGENQSETKEYNNDDECVLICQ